MRVPLLSRTARATKRPSSAPQQLPPPPHINWPNYRAPWPSYMLEDRESKRELIAELNKRAWFHKIDLGGGDATPDAGGTPQIQHIQQAFLDTDFHGKKVLDIGAWDGQWSFECEKRGAAEVYATDLVTQRTGDVSSFELCHAILNSRVKYFPQTSVYNVHQLDVFDFDIILYMGVFYHIKDPLLALARLRQVAKPGTIIFVEGEVIWSDRSYADYYYHTDYALSPSNWWIPSIPCLRQWIECSFFEIEKEYLEWDGMEAYWKQRNYHGRCLIKARAVPVPPQSPDDMKNFFSRYDFLEPNA
jgi:tRNA (mo5U34)-methyltransferase